MGGNSGQARGFGGRPHSRGRRQRKFKISNFRFGETAKADMDRVTRRYMGHLFAGVTSAGAASGRPYGEKFYGQEGNRYGFVEYQTRRGL